MSNEAFVDSEGKLVYDTNDWINKTYLTRPPGRYFISEGINLVVTGVRGSKPYFNVTVSKKVNGERVELTANQTIPGPLHYWAIEGLAYKRRAELIEALEEGAKSSLLEHEMEQARKRKEAAERKKAHRNTAAVENARKDVAGVLARYGPHLRLNEPYFIQQWM